jgi:hypothetical protein
MDSYLFDCGNIASDILDCAGVLDGETVILALETGLVHENTTVRSKA